MEKVKIEVFLSTSNDINDIRLASLINETGGELGDRVEIIVHHGHDNLFREYKLTNLPALVVGELIKIMGFCPSKETLLSAVRETGTE